MGILTKIKQAILGNPADAPIKAAKMKRSPKWPATRAAHLKLYPQCAVCGEKNMKMLEVHHIRPFHLHPELENDMTNLITLCEDHHLLFGHLMDWHAENPDVRVDAALILDKILARRKQAGP